jgi:hypothetical protein
MSPHAKLQLQHSNGFSGEEKLNWGEKNHDSIASPSLFDLAVCFVAISLLSPSPLFRDWSIS